MSFLVTIYEHRIGFTQYSWTTLGLGSANIDDKGTSLPLLKERFLHKLKAWVKKAKARELAVLEKLPGLTLERHRLTLDLKRLSATLNVPLVLEPRFTGVGEPLIIGYHPLAQQDFFVVDPERPIALQYRVFLLELMRDAADGDALKDLETRKDRIRTLVFDAEIPSLLERVGPAKGAWWSDLRPENDKKKEDEGVASELDEIAVDLSERATESALTIGLSREPFGTQLRTLAARGSVVVVGPPGVGKTTLIHRWVSERLNEDGYAIHRSLDQVRKIWSLSGRRILAGMKHHGDWEARVAKLIDELQRRRGHLYVPDLQAWARLGRTRDSERCLADVMRGPLERREVTIVGEATREAWARMEEEAPAFAAQFQILTLPEPHPDELVRMLLATARTMEDEGVQFDTAVFDVVRDWSELLYPGRAEPGRSLALLEESKKLDDWIGEYELIDALSERAGVPYELLGHRSQVANYVPDAMNQIRAHVVGQTEATEAMADLMQRIRTGLTDPARPWGVFLFTGPTGTGKTELAKGLALQLYGDDDRLLRIDMNQLSGPDAASRLIGDALQPDGRLTGPILDSPFQVVLLDELEKAHPSVLYLLLQLLDEGRLTDAAGRTADFRRTVILITSNLGASPRPPTGFGDAPTASVRRADTTRAVAAALPPELFNRLDGVVAFQPLGREVALTIAARAVAKLSDRPGLRDRHGSLVCTPAALDLIVAAGFDPEYGARTVKRWIESNITDPIAAGLVRLPGDHFKRVRVDARAGNIDIEIDALAPAGKTHALPFAYLLDFSPSDCDRPLDQMATTLAEAELALGLRPEQDEADMHRVVAPVDADEADRLYWRDQLQSAIADTLKTLRRIRNIRRSPLRDIVEALSRAAFLVRIAPRVDSDIHRVTLRLSRPMRGALRRLLPALVDAYRAPPFEVEDYAKQSHDGRVTTDLRQVNVEDAERVVLRLAGLGVREAFVGEVGSHVLDTMAGGLEVVTVQVLPPAADAQPAKSLLAAVSELDQQVRTLRHEAAQANTPAAKEARPYVAIDHRTGHEESGHILELAQLVAWCLALSISAEPVAAVATNEVAS